MPIDEKYYKEFTVEALQYLLGSCQATLNCMERIRGKIRAGQYTNAELQDYISELYGDCLVGDKPPEVEFTETVINYIESIELEIKKRKRCCRRCL